LGGGRSNGERSQLTELIKKASERILRDNRKNNSFQIFLGEIVSVY